MKHLLFAFIFTASMALLKSISSNFNDEDLLQDYKSKNNLQSLATLFMRYSDLVYGVCVKYLKSQEKSKDATMEIYAELQVKAKSHNIDNFKSWLYVVAKNYCLMQLRKEKNKQVVEFDGNGFMQSEEFEHLDNVLQKESDFKKLENCLQQLNPEQNEVINLFYLQQNCYNQIVEKTGVDWNKIRSLIQNGRRNLKICMEKNEE